MRSVALSPFRVLEVAHSVGGAFCGKMLAGCGADVIKVEEPGVGDPLRTYGPFPGDIPHPDQSGLFMHLNTGKKSITLDFSKKAGRDIFKGLAEAVDVIIEDHRPGFLRERGLDYEALARANPAIVMTSVTPFGQSGPCQGYKATELTTFALSGYMSITGSPSRGPLKAYGHLGEYQAGMCAAVGTMIALCAREGTGSGQYVDVSAMESLVMLLAFAVPVYFASGEIEKRAGSGHHRFRSGTSSVILPCKDGHVLVHPLSSTPGALGLLTGQPQLDDPGLSEEQFIDLLGPWLLARDKAEIVRLAQELRLPFAEVLDPEELLRDLQHESRGMWNHVHYPMVGSLIQPGAPFRMDVTPWETRRAPSLGEHNKLIYRTHMNLSSQDLVRLRQQGII